MAIGDGLGRSWASERYKVRWATTRWAAARYICSRKKNKEVERKKRKRGKEIGNKIIVKYFCITKLLVCHNVIKRFNKILVEYNLIIKVR